VSGDSHARAAIPLLTRRRLAKDGLVFSHLIESNGAYFLSSIPSAVDSRPNLTPGFLCGLLRRGQSPEEL